MMRLRPDETTLFFKLWFSLLSYVSGAYPAILGGVKTFDEIAHARYELLALLRDKLYEERRLIDDFARENPCHLTPEEVQIVSEWRHFVWGQFILLRQLKSYAIFLSVGRPVKAYGVLASNDSFEEMTEFPSLVWTGLLPFRGRIVYDGILGYSNVTFGRGIRDDISSEYERAKSRYGIITSLPFAPAEPSQSDEDLLRFYLKSERNREEHWDDICDLIQQNPSLRPLYHQDFGKRTARALKRSFKSYDIAPAWFGVLDEILIASGKTRQDVMDAIEWMLPVGRRPDVYIFQWKP